VWTLVHIPGVEAILPASIVSTPGYQFLTNILAQEHEIHDAASTIM
jgi:hypothetical protein